ncbi:MAG: hypothetical protein WDW36_002259 [Sanguina aurantia]
MATYNNTLFNEDGSEVAAVLQRDIPWDTYMTARLITDKDLQLIRKYDKRSDDQRSSLLDEAGPAYIDAFVSVLRNVTKEETVQYVLALLVKMLQENPKHARLFHHPSDQRPAGAPDILQVFIRLLQRQDWFTQEKACKILTLLIESRPKSYSAFSNGVLSSEASTSSSAAASVYAGEDPAEQHISSFIDWLVSELRKPSHAPKAVACSTSCLAALLHERGCRALFLRAGGVQVLPGLIRSSNSPSNSQLLYELSLCVWQMTYIHQAAAAMGISGTIKARMARKGTVKALVDVARLAQKEKVFRVTMSALRNLLNYTELGLASDMVEAGLPKIVATRQLQTWGDSDIPELLSYLDESLKAGMTVLSSFERYRKEVLSGSLDWSPMHTSELFWKANIDKFEEKDFQILRVLLKLIEASREFRTQAVGCFDLGQFIQYHPQGRYIVADLRGKELVMRLMGHPDAEVQKQALLTVQKIMLTKDKLEFLSA